MSKPCLPVRKRERLRNPQARKQSGGVSQGKVASLTAADATAIADECSAIQATSPIVFTGGIQVIGGNVNWSPGQMRGVGPGFLQVRNWQMAAGEFFGERDVG